MDDPVTHSKAKKAVLLAGSTLTVMAGATISPALPAIELEFAQHPHSELLVQLVLTLPALCITIGSPLAGVLTDFWGRRPVFIASVLLYGVGGSSGLFLDNLYAILLGRGLLGFAIAGVMTSCTTLIGDYFDGGTRHRFLGMQAALMSGGGVLFVMAGGFLSDFGWRYPFAVYGVAFFLLPAILVTIDEPDRPHRYYDASPGANPRLPYGVLGLIYSTAIGSVVVLYMIPTQFPFYFRDGFGASGGDIGLAIGAANTAGAIVSWNNRRWVHTVSFPAIFACTFALLGSGFVVISNAQTLIGVYLGLLILGSGMGLMLPNLNLWLLAHAPDRLRGRLVGGITMSVFLGQFISPILVRPIVEWRGIAGTFALVGVFAIFVPGGLFAAYHFWQRRHIKQSRADEAGFRH